MATTYKRGENLLIERSLLQSDGETALNFSALTSAAVDLWQGDKLIETYVAGTDPELRQGSTATKIEFELTEEIGDLLVPGVQLKLEWVTSVADADFTVDSSTHKDRAHDPEQDLFDVE